jgi:nitrile hydratase subunit beta
VNGAHDLGGQLGFGRVIVEPNEPVFHHEWEGLAFALNMASIGSLRAYNADAYRHSVERVDGYLSKSYYERLLTGVTTLLVEGGVVSLDEVESLAGGSVPVAMPVAASAVASSSEFQEYERVQPTFAAGDNVRVVAASTDGHTRCPAYLRGAVGSIEKVYPLAHFPEVRAHSSLRCREHTYAVTFEASTLWPGDSASAVGHSVVVEVFESYLRLVSDA